MTKNELAILMAIIAAILMILNLSVSIKINIEIRKRILDSGIADRNGFIFRYLRIFKEYKVQLNGNPGILYYVYIISLTLCVSFLFAGIIIISI